MSDTSDIDDIREKKIEELKKKAQAPETPDTPSEPVHLNGEAELDEFVQEHGTVIVDFHAEWCGPCKMMEPVMDSFAEREGVAIGKVDIDQNQMLAQGVGVQGVPTFFLYSDGDVVQRLVGAQDESRFAQFVEQHA